MEKISKSLAIVNVAQLLLSVMAALLHATRYNYYKWKRHYNDCSH